MTRVPLTGLTLAALVGAGGARASGARHELATGRGSVTAPVHGAVAIALQTAQADIEIVPTDKAQVTLTVDRPEVQLALISAGGERLEAEFDGHRQLRRGHVRLEIPRGSPVDLATMSGAIHVRRVGGDVRVRGMSGPVEIAGAGQVDVETIDGPVELNEVTGPVRIHTISGNTVVASPNPALQLELETAGGNLDLSSACAKGCHIDTDSVTGELRLRFEKKSSFGLRFVSHSGKMKSDLSLTSSSVAPASGETGVWSDLAYGRGEGLVECETFSGNLTIQQR